MHSPLQPAIRHALRSEEVYSSGLKDRLMPEPRLMMDVLQAVCLLEEVDSDSRDDLDIGRVDTLQILSRPGRQHVWQKREISGLPRHQAPDSCCRRGWDGLLVRTPPPAHQKHVEYSQLTRIADYSDMISKLDSEPKSLC